VSKTEHLPRLRQLLQQQRWAALATLDGEQRPEASMVAYVLDEERGAVYLHLSTLAGHTRNLARNPQASLVISECDKGHGDPQQLARASLFGQITVITREEEGYETAKQRYLQRLADAAPLFDFGDFRLFRFHIERIRFVGGFAQAHSYRPEALQD
jgi:putative heme iron utilization protein